MVYSLRTIALLMLVAGLCLGVFAGSLVAIKRSPTPLTLEQRVEERVKLYREIYELDVASTDAIRRELQRFRRVLRDKLAELRQRHADEFSKLAKETEAEIQEILKQAGVEVDAPEKSDEDAR